MMAELLQKSPPDILKQHMLPSTPQLFGTVRAIFNKTMQNHFMHITALTHLQLIVASSATTKYVTTVAYFEFRLQDV